MDLSVLLWLQSGAHPAWDCFFYAVTMLGDERFYLILLALIYWNVSPQCGYRATVLLLVSTLLNTGLKDGFDTLRPFQAFPKLFPVSEAVQDTAGGGAFPSGHAQNATAVWGGLWLILRKPWLLGLAGGMVILISLSRLYLLVHWPQDVLGGMAFGVLLLSLAAGVWYCQNAWWPHGNRWARLSLAVLIPLVLCGLAPVFFVTELSLRQAYQVNGALLGLSLGHVLVAPRLEATPRRSPKRKFLGSLAALILLLAWYAGLKRYFPETDFFRFLRYALIGLWVPVAAWLLYAGPSACTGEEKREGE